MKVKRLYALIGLFAILSLSLPAAAVQAAAPAPATQITTGVPRFEQGPCAFKAQPGVVEGVDVVCGTLIVPELYEKPDGPTISLGVAIVKSTSTSPRPDPVVFAQGGPGGSTIDYYTQVLFSSRVRRNRDLVLFDQRGTLYSKPNLFCQELFDETVRQLPLNLNAYDSNQGQDKAALACRDRLVKQGVNLTAYNSVENANDIESLRKALGYKQINLYGVSYGTLLALHAMRQNPGGLRSVILDSVVDPTINFNFDSPNAENRAFSELFKACQEDSACNASYPNLEKTFFDLVARLNQKPVPLHITDSETGKTYAYLFNGDALVQALFEMLYSAELLPFLPKTIHNVGAGRYDFLERILSQFVLDRSVNYGMYFSTVCAEGGTDDPSQASYPNVRPQLSKDADVQNKALVQLCTSWKVPALSAADEGAVSSDIPTLIFGGRFDPITPPANGADVAKTLSNSYAFTFPNTGHGALTSNACADSIFLEFLSNPGRAPDGSCIASQPAVKFLTSRDVIDTAATSRTVSALNELILDHKIPWEGALFGGLVLALLSAVVVFPLAWLIRNVNGKPGKDTPQLAHLAGWIPVMNAGVLIAFAGGFIAMLFILSSNSDSSLMFGVPTKYAPILILPLISLVLSAAMVIFAAAGWAGRYWSTSRKIYYSLLTLAGIACAVMMGGWGLLTALLGI